MSPFDEAFNWILAAEGGYVNNPKDPGGATKLGVSLKAVKLRDVDKDGLLDFDLDKDGDVDAEDIKLVTVADAKRFYKEDYWSLKGAGFSNKLSCDSLPRRWGIVVFDAAVLQGPRTAVALMQRAIGVTDDGILGPGTLNKLKAIQDQKQESPKLARFAQHRLDRMRKHPQADTFFPGWVWRVVLLHQKVYSDIGL